MAEGMTDEELEAYLEFLDSPEPEEAPAQVKDEGWSPRLNPTQQLIFDDPSTFVLGYGEKGCRTSDTLIYTENGLKRLGSLRPENAKPGTFTPIKQKVVSFNEKSACMAEADGFWVEPSDEALRAELANGAEITGSHRHPLWVCWDDGKAHGFGYKSLSEMQKGRAAGTRYWTPFMEHPNWTASKFLEVSGCTLTPVLAYAIGALVGDGSLNISTGDCRSVGFTNMDPECLDAVSNGLSEVGCVLRSIPSRKYHYTVIGPRGVARNLIKALGIDHLSYYKRIPDQIVESPLSVVCAFLSGLFDTDGTTEKIGLVSFCTVSETLSRDVQDILAALGMLCVRRPKKSASGRPTWTLSLMGKHAFRFSHMIGFKISRKQARITVPKESQMHPSGFNQNRYGYPDPIRRAMRAVAYQNRTKKRAGRAPYKFKKKVGRRKTRWYFNRYVPWKDTPLCLSVESEAETWPIEVQLEEQRADYLEGRHRSRQWHDDHRHLHSFGSVAGPDKLYKFCELYQCAEQFKQFTVSDTWLEVEAITEVKAELFDLHVPGTHAFLASGTINHNSGKGIGFLHKIVRHAYENNNALVFMVAPMAYSGGEGVWYDMEFFVLPAWKEGNRDPKTQELLDHGMGLEYTSAKLDPVTKHRIIWIGNRFGGWSKVVLLSIPYASMVEQRIKGPAPSMVYIDEITDTDGKEYFTFPAAQLRRRRGISGPQQFCASCNPKGPSHWVYKVFFEDCLEPGGKLCQDGKRRNSEFSVYHVRIQENSDNLPEGYIAHLHRTFGSDPVEIARHIDGLWVERPSGRALFKNYFIPSIHVIGDAKKGIGALPVKGFPIIVGYDPGPVNFSIHFTQQIITEEKIFWLDFDELNYVGKYMPYPRVIPELVRRMLYWQKKMGDSFWFEHIADEAAFNQVNTSGSFDAAEIERLVREYLEQHPEIGIQPFRLKPCPKGNDSVPARVRMAINLLQSECYYVSAMCHATIQMWQNLESEDEKPGKYDPLVGFRPKRSIHLHPFDSSTYPKFFFNATGVKAATLRTDRIEPKVYAAGVN